MITSTGNARVKLVRALRTRRERDHTGLAWVEGIRPTVEALQLSAPVDTLVVAPDLLSSDFARDAVEGARLDGMEIMEVSGAVFRSLSDRDGPQGLGAIVRQQWLSLPDVRLAEGNRWVALASVADPGNLGTILRTCDGSDAEGVILLDASTDPYDPAAMRASMGAVFSRRLVRATFEAFATWARAEGATVVGASDRAPSTYREASYGDRTVLLMGSEREGLTTEQQTLCDQMVSIPMRGRADSLNLAVATAILLYEVLDRRDTATDGESRA
ncbi:MAG: RNA methyltransferase [Chloroflexota bacterium]